MSRLSRHALHCFAFTLIFTLILVACALPGPAPQPTAVPPTSAPTTAFTVTPTEITSTDIELNSELRVEASGFRLNYPGGWQTVKIEGTETWAMSPSTAAIQSATISNFPVVMIDSTPLDAIAEQRGAEVIMTTQAFLDFASAVPQNQGFQVGEPTIVRVGGYEGKAADLRAEGGAGRLVVVLTETHAIRVLGQAAPEVWEEQQAVFQAIVESLRFFTPPVTPTPTPENQAQQPLRTVSGPEGVVLRVGGNAGPTQGRFVSARGLTAAPDGTVYLAESGRGIWVFNAQGDLVATIGERELLDAYDVARSPNGDLFVADYGRNAIAHFKRDGTLVRRWGERGDGPEQFSLSSPQRLALGANGSIYALDNRVAANGSTVNSSIVRFNSENGSFIERISLPAGINPSDIAIDAEGNFYIADTFARAVIKLDNAGREVARIGTNVRPEGIAPSAIDLDADGNIYVATWDAGILKFAPAGTLLGRVGAVAAPESIPKIGEFSLPNGLAVTPKDIIWVSDNTGEYSAVTAIQMINNVDVEATAAAAAIASGEITPVPEDALVRQWAKEATASSAYEGYDAENVTGPPNVTGCIDSMDAWASADPNGLEKLEVRFEQPVFATQVNIHQNHQPGFITNVELLDDAGKTLSVYKAEPALQAECPYVLTVDFVQTPRRIVGVRLTVDQRSGANWNEIDAVELVGVAVQ